MAEMTRREVLKGVCSACATGLLSCQKQDWFERELVCIHIFSPKDSLPAPLLEKPVRFPQRRAARDYFHAGLPELLVCMTRTKFLEMFQYFWPFSRDDFERLRSAIHIDFQKPFIAGSADIEEFAHYLQAYKESLHNSGMTRAAIFTYHEFTRHWISSVVEACRDASVDELVLFKDPSRAPYLCDYPSRQKGFKKPPP